MLFCSITTSFKDRSNFVTSSLGGVGARTGTTSFKDRSNVVMSSLVEVGTRTGTHVRPPRSAGSCSFSGMWGSTLSLLAWAFSFDIRLLFSIWGFESGV